MSRKTWKTLSYGTTRTVTKFLWLPKNVTFYQKDSLTTGTSDRERRWFEWATWEEKWAKGAPCDFWKTTKFLPTERPMWWEAWLVIRRHWRS